mmetsp:Transcript_17549/g.24989  ORF Transcript_17549/g.24989 Transcript_17549/m.24989 type:complete len:252 (+) Transcript_17549:118-873(+)
MANDDGIAAARAKMIKERFGGQSASIGGKGSVRRNKKVASKRGATNIPEIKEVNYFKKDGRFIYHRPIEARMCEQPFWKSIWQATTECLSDAYHRRQHIIWIQKCMDEERIRKLNDERRKIRRQQIITMDASDMCFNNICTKKGRECCKGCKLAWYCSEKCQEDHWRGHKNCCKMISSSPTMLLRYFNAVKGYKIGFNQRESEKFDQSLLSLQEALEIFKEFKDDENRSSAEQQKSIRRGVSELSQGVGNP